MTPREAEILTPVFPAVEQLAPHEIVLMHRQARETSSEFERPLDAYLEWSPRYNLPRARELYIAFAESPVAANRIQIGYIITCLTSYDRELGLRLWSQLLRDPDTEVREAALEELHRPLADNRHLGHSSGEQIDQWRISWEDACNLYTDYIEADRWRQYHHLGQTATQSVAERQHPQADGQ